MTEQETPLQTIFIEQVAKVISSSSRLIWTNIREGSGRLSSGRTVLGTIVDPLGLFRTSPIVRMNELDERTMETTSSLIALLGEQVQTEENNALDISDLSPSETQEILSILVKKVWERRNGFLKTGNRLATKLLQLTADKLEAGERDVLVLPKEDSPSTPMPAETVKNTLLTESPSSDNPSSRMLHAQQILQDVEQQEVLNKV